MNKIHPNELRDGIFNLNTRRFGTVAEILIKILIKSDWGKNQFHDLYDNKNKKRIEVKFSTALKAYNESINEKKL